MKKLKQLFLISIIIVFAFPSCKKGENDPFLSLRSRKARLTGEWELKAGTLTFTDISGSWTTTYNGTTATSPSGTYLYTEKWSIKKDGSFELTNNFDGDISTTKGYWSFGDKVKGMDLKNKESVIFRVTSETYVNNGNTNTGTYTGTSCPVFTYNIIELKNKVMAIKVEGTDTWSTNFDSNSGTMTFNQ